VTKTHGRSLRDLEQDIAERLQCGGFTRLVLTIDDMNVVPGRRKGQAQILKMSVTQQL